MRLFLGLDLPVELKQRLYYYLVPLQLSLKGWENWEDYHVTLKFIGEVGEEDQEEIIARLRKFTFYPFVLSLDQISFFNRRIMYMGLKPSKELLELKEHVDKAFSNWGEHQVKTFKPHITVKRWQRYEYASLERGVLHQLFSGGEFLVDRLILFKSEKIPPDRKYQIVEINKF